MKWEDEPKFTSSLTYVKGKQCLGKRTFIYFKFEGDPKPERIEFKSLDLSECATSYTAEIISPDLISKFKLKSIKQIYTSGNEISILIDWLTASVIKTSIGCLYL